MADRDIELAHLRLAALVALRDMQIPTGETIKVGDREFPAQRPIVNWALMPESAPETPTEETR